MFISVVIPLYNKAPWVMRALHSVAGQTHPDFECLVVNDGSTDDGGALVAEFARKDSRFRLINQANAGVSAARNTGWRAAQNDWIAFLDADDEWHPHFLRTVLAVARPAAANLGIIGTNFACDHTQQKQAVAQPTGIIKNYFEDRFRRGDHILSCSTVAIRRQALAEVNGFNPQMALYEDIYTWIRIALRYDIYFIDVVLASYRNDDKHSALNRLRVAPLLHDYLVFAKLCKIDQALIKQRCCAAAYVQCLTINAATRLWRYHHRLLSLRLLLHLPHPMSHYGRQCIFRFLLDKIKRALIDGINFFRPIKHAR